MLTSNPYIILGATVFVGLSGAWVGWNIRDADYQSYLAAEKEADLVAQEEVKVLEDQLETQTQKHRDELALAKAQTRTVFRNVIQEVPVYVSETQFAKDVDANGGLPAGFVWSYNQAASNSTAPLPPGFNLDTPTEVGVSTLATVTAGNFAVCYDWRDENTAWRNWHREATQVWEQYRRDTQRSSGRGE